MVDCANDSGPFRSMQQQHQKYNIRKEKRKRKNANKNHVQNNNNKVYDSNKFLFSHCASCCSLHGSYEKRILLKCRQDGNFMRTWSEFLPSKCSIWNECQSKHKHIIMMFTYLELYVVVLCCYCDQPDPKVQLWLHHWHYRNNRMLR